MLENKLPEKRPEFEIVCLEDYIPQDHLLRKIKKHIDFSFIRDIVSHLYSPDAGRPAIDPIVLIKMLFIGYLYGIRSERQLEQEIKVNMAYRWFLDLGISGKVPHHSTISLNRVKRFQGTSVFQDIFDRIVEQAMKHGLIEGRVLFTDSTHLKANANKKKYTTEQITETTKEYMEELNLAVNADRKAHGKKPLREKKQNTVKPSSPQPLKATGGETPSLPEESVSETQAPRTREIKVSTTDVESGYMYREGKPEGFFYLDHRTVDFKYNLITDVHITAGNVHDSVPYLSRLERQKTRFGFEVEAVALDAGYLTSALCHGLSESKIFGVIGHRRFSGVKGMFAKRKYRYDPTLDCYVCPAGENLRYRTTTREGYREYVSNPEKCRMCELLNQCTQSRNKVKVVTRHVWAESLEEVHNNRLSPEGKRLYKARCQTIERSFADAKELHAYRYCRFRGKERVQEQALLTAGTQNIKKIACILSTKG
jgi:transposase